MITTQVIRSWGVLVGLGIGLVLCALLISISEAHAQLSPNILVSQDLTVGSTGLNVAVLQGLLSEMGYLDVPVGIPYGYFGSLTRDAVARYQAATNVSPAAGYYGPITKVAMRSHFANRGWLTVLGW